MVHSVLERIDDAVVDLFLELIDSVVQIVGHYIVIDYEFLVQWVVLSHSETVAIFVRVTLQRKVPPFRIFDDVCNLDSREHQWENYKQTQQHFEKDSCAVAGHTVLGETKANVAPGAFVGVSRVQTLARDKEHAHCQNHQRVYEAYEVVNIHHRQHWLGYGYHL